MSLPGATEVAPGARSQPRLRREEEEQGIALSECVECGAPNEVLCLTECMYGALFHGYDIIAGTAAAHDAP